VIDAEGIRESLEASGLRCTPQRYAVMAFLTEQNQHPTAAEIFGLPVRIGVPSTIAGLTDSVKQPQYATAVGLVLFGPRGEAAPHLNGHGGSGSFAKLWSWFSSIWN